jgi:WD40 repeat protein
VSYALAAGTIQAFEGHRDLVYGLAVSPDGRLIASGGADKIINIWSVASHELLGTLFEGTDREWVVWTPQGYYSSSPGGETNIVWQVNQSSPRPEYVGADQLRSHFNRPDIVEKAIMMASAERAVSESPGTTFRIAELLARSVPRFRIVSPPGGVRVKESGRTQVTIRAEAVPDPIKSIRTTVNGSLTEEISPQVSNSGPEPWERTLDVPLAKGRNEIRITLTNAVGERDESLAITLEGDGDLDNYA